MKLICTIVIALTILLCSTASHAADASLQPTYLRCEYLVNPLGIGETNPRLSWVLESSRRTDRQSAYRVLVASAKILAENRGDLWDSGKVDSDENAFVVYSGTPLKSRDACYWKVEVWSALGGDGQWSDTASWTMGLLKAADWQAKWIDCGQSAGNVATTQPVTIIKATYSAVRRSATSQATTATSRPSSDVTEKLRSLVTDGVLDIRVNNETLGGDPAPDQHKHLVVEYEVDGRQGHVTVNEDQPLRLPPTKGPTWILRQKFATKGEVKQATLYVTALGIYEMHINGQRVGDQVLAPDWTDYNKRIRYQAYDVTAQIKPGENGIAGLLANGWYAGHLGNGGYQQYGTKPALLAQLEITYADGTTDRIVTDDTWQARPNPSLASDFMLGESYDAQKEIAWQEPSSDEPGWAPASIRKDKQRPLEWEISQPVRETGQTKPIGLTEPKPGHWTFDMGQNMVGVVRLKVNAPAGTVVTLHHAEMLNPDGTVYTTNLRGAPSVDAYTCKGTGEETWQPTFTFHGFRYVEVTGLSERPSTEAVTGIVLGSDTPRTGSFACSDAQINKLFSNIQWGQRGNYLSVPTDCPQRDERLGWMGDAQVFVRTATCNADVASFFSKWLVDVDDAQSADGAFSDVSPRRAANDGTPAWGDAGVICPWTIYMAYGDRRLLEQNLPAMTKWVEWCKAHSNGLLRDDKASRGGDYGDWLSIKADTPKDLIGTAYFAYSTHLVAKSYAAVGNREQADKYQKLFEDIKAAFNKAYVQPDGRIKGNTQCCYLMALKFDLLPDDLRPKAAQYLVEDIKAKDNHLSTGFVGVSYLLPVLTQSGNLDVAYKLLFQDSFPSWLFSVKHGATTIWERWDGWTPEKGFQDPGMNSFNHYSLGSCGEWLYDSAAGIMWDENHPGYKHIIIRPQPGEGLTWVKANITCPYGPISTEWHTRPIVDNDSNFELTVNIPPNTTATVYVPVKPGQVVGNFDMQGITFLRNEKGAKVYEIQSGTYSFPVLDTGK